MEYLTKLTAAILDTLVSIPDILLAIRDALLGHQLTRTRFISVILDKNALQGVPIGQGKCKGVRVKGNFFKTGETAVQLFTEDVAQIVCGYFYYGDSKQQTWEYLIVQGIPFYNNDTGQLEYRPIPNTAESKFIPCKDLNDVWLRYPQGFTPASESAPSIEVQVQIYD